MLLFFNFKSDHESEVKPVPKFGEIGEKRACQFLKKKGYMIVHTNYRWPGGEADIVARDGDYLVFVEVKTRSSNKYGLPEEAITEEKKQRITRTARYYIAQNRPEISIRFDVVAISKGKIRLYKDAFSGGE